MIEILKDTSAVTRRAKAALAFALISTVYWAVSIYLFLMLALGDCAAHFNDPPGHCWGDDLNARAVIVGIPLTYFIFCGAFWWRAARELRASQRTSAE